jgi:signal transduction histidine kinase
MKKVLPLTVILIGTALLIIAAVFWIDTGNSAKAPDFGQSLRNWVTLLAGLGVSLRGWMDLAKKETPPSPTRGRTDEDSMIRGTVSTLGKDVIGRDPNITTNVVSEDGANDAESFAQKVEETQWTDEMHRANRAKRDLVGFIAHELKNPMTSIKGYAELLAAGSVGPVNEMQVNFLNTIRANVERMSALLSDLNDDAMIEANSLRLEFKSVDLPNMVDEVVRSTKRQIEEKHQTLELRLPPQLPLAWVDSIRVGQILAHLVNNAHKYTPEGGKIVVGAEVLPNQWEPNGARQVIHFWVQDDGIGIRPENQAKIFQKFFQSDDPKAREVPGTGLGLNITKRVVEMMGGRIWFESEYGRGTTFHFTVPVAEG